MLLTHEDLGDRRRYLNARSALRTLLDLGVVPGTVVRAEMRSAAGDPVAYRIRGALIALRRGQAEWVGVAEHPRSDAMPGAA